VIVRLAGVNPDYSRAERHHRGAFREQSGLEIIEEESWDFGIMFSFDFLKENRTAVVFTVVSIVAFGITRFLFLEEFPIYFFCDEAFIGVETKRLITNGFFGPVVDFLPMYWDKAQGRWVPQVSIYLSILPTLLFPRTIWALRMVTGIVSLLGILIGCWGLQKTSRVRELFWLPLAFATIMPVLILHNRLAFETSNAISGLFAAIGLYLAYRLENPKYLTGFIAAFFFTFYSHWSGSIVITAACFLLLIIDAPYHITAFRKFPRFMWGHTVLVLFCAVPFLRFLYSQPQGVFQQLSILRSGLATSTPISVLLESAFMRYIVAFDPSYWFSYNYLPDQLRHLWKDRPFLATFSDYPFLIGLVVSIATFWTVRSRVLLIFLLCGALPVTMVDAHVQRMFYIVAPVILLMTVGVMVFYQIFKVQFLKTFIQLIAVGVLLVQTAVLTREFLGAGLWYTTYTLGGLQWGAKALFAEAIPKLLSENPSVTITPSGEWANGADIFPQFFLNEEQLTRIQGVPFDLLHPESDQRIPLDRVFILSPPERERITGSGKFKSLKPVLEIPYPDGTPGFTFAHLEYVDDIEEIMAPERLARLVPQHTAIPVWGTNAAVTYSRVDNGDITEVFDRNFFTLARGMVANPFLFDMSFQEPRRGTGIKIDLFPMDVRVKVTVRDSQGSILAETSGEAKRPEVNKDTSIELRFANSPVLFNRIEVEIYSLTDLPNRAHIHVRELVLLP